MGIAVDGDHIVPGFQHIGFGAAVVIGSHILHVEGDGHIFRRAGFQDLGLGQADQVGGSFLNAAVGIGRVVIDFHNILAGHIAGIGDGGADGDDAVGLGDAVQGLAEAGVAQAVTKGILHDIVVVDQAFGGGSLIELVADVDAFDIVDEGGQGPIHRKLIHVGVLEQADVVVGRGGGQVIDKGVGGLGGGVDSAGDDVAQAVEAGLAGAGTPQHTFDLGVVLHKAQLHGGRAVVDQGDVVKVLADHLHHGFFLVGQVQVGIALIPVGAFVEGFIIGLGVAHFGGAAVGQFIHIGGQVSAFAANAGDDDDRLVRIGLGVVHQVGVTKLGVAVTGHIRFGDGPVAFPHADHGAVRLVLGIEIDQFLVGGKPGIAQAVQQADQREFIAQGTRAGAAIAGVGGRPAEYVDIVARSKRQVAAVVLQQDNALIRNGLTQLGSRSDRFIADGAAAGRQRNHRGHGAEGDQVCTDAEGQQNCQASLAADHVLFGFGLLFAGDHCDDSDHQHYAESDQIRRHSGQHVQYVFDVDCQHVDNSSLLTISGMKRAHVFICQKLV